jgi:hypothetical protein
MFDEFGGLVMPEEKKYKVIDQHRLILPFASHELAKSQLWNLFTKMEGEWLSDGNKPWPFFYYVSDKDVVLTGSLELAGQVVSATAPYLINHSDISLVVDEAARKPAFDISLFLERALTEDTSDEAKYFSRFMQPVIGRDFDSESSNISRVRNSVWSFMPPTLLRAFETRYPQSATEIKDKYDENLFEKACRAFMGDVAEDAVVVLAVLSPLVEALPENLRRLVTAEEIPAKIRQMRFVLFLDHVVKNPDSDEAKVFIGFVYLQRDLAPRHAAAAPIAPALAALGVIGGESRSVKLASVGGDDAAANAVRPPVLAS